MLLVVEVFDNLQRVCFRMFQMWICVATRCLANVDASDVYCGIPDSCKYCCALVW